MKDKIDQLLDLLDNPDSFSDEELNRLLEDREIRDLYESTRKTIDILSETTESNMDNEWQKFADQNLKLRHKNIFHILSDFVTRNAAVIILCAVSSLGVVAATIGLRYALAPRNDISLQAADSLDIEPEAIVANDPVQAPVEPVDEVTTVVFKNKSLITILSSIADYYEVDLDVKSKASEELRLYFQWDKTLPIEKIVEQLNNFEQVDIELTDNTINLK